MSAVTDEQVGDFMMIVENHNGGLVSSFRAALEACERTRPTDPRVMELIEAATAYVDAEESLANRECMGINAESHDRLQPRVHAARRDLRAALAAFKEADNG